VWRWIQGLAYRSNERESSNSVDAAVVARVKGPQPVQLTALWARKGFFEHLYSFIAAVHLVVYSSPS
jgi:hypothetical protein